MIDRKAILLLFLSGICSAVSLDKFSRSSIKYMGGEPEFGSLAQKAPPISFDQRVDISKRSVIIMMAIVAVVLYWIILSQFVLPASKDANIELRDLEMKNSMDSIQYMTVIGALKKKERERAKNQS